MVERHKSQPSLMAVQLLFPVQMPASHRHRLAVPETDEYCRYIAGRTNLAQSWVGEALSIRQCCLQAEIASLSARKPHLRPPPISVAHSLGHQAIALCALGPTHSHNPAPHVLSRCACVRLVAELLAAGESSANWL
jgi:hypothetical protein